MSDAIKLRPSGPRGWPCGEQHHGARHADAVVAQARALRASG